MLRVRNSVDTAICTKPCGDLAGQLLLERFIAVQQFRADSGTGFVTAAMAVAGCSMQFVLPNRTPLPASREAGLVQIACALFETVEARRLFRFGELMAYLRRGGRLYAKEDQEANPRADRPAPAGSGPFQDCRTQQPQLPEVATKLSIRDGPIHQLVLF